MIADSDRSLTWISFGGLACVLLIIVLVTVTTQGPETEPAAKVVAAPAPKTGPLEAYGRLDVDFLTIPAEQLDDFRKLFDGPAVSDLTDFLKKSHGTVTASASAGIRTSGELTVFEINSGQLSILPQKISPDQICLSGRFSGPFFGSFNSLLQPGAYQLLVILDQPANSTPTRSFNAIVARMQDVKWTKTDAPPEEASSAILPSLPPPPPVSNQTPVWSSPRITNGFSRILYVNSGDNTVGFVVKSAEPNFTVLNNTLVGNAPGHQGRDDDTGWFALPVWAMGDFQIDFDAFPDANDAASWVFLFDDASNRGVVISNATQTSFGDHSLSINSMDDVTNYDQFFNHHATLANSPAGRFSNHSWTHITITKKGNILTDNVGGQIISADLSNVNFPARVHVGLGYYATKNVGGNGQFRYANIRIVRTGAYWWWPW